MMSNTSNATNVGCLSRAVYRTEKNGTSARISLLWTLCVGSPCNFERVYMRVQRQRAKGGRGAGFGGGLVSAAFKFFKISCFLSVTWRPAKVASVRHGQTSGKCSSGYNDVNNLGIGAREECRK